MKHNITPILLGITLGLILLFMVTATAQTSSIKKALVENQRTIQKNQVILEEEYQILKGLAGSCN